MEVIWDQKEVLACYLAGSLQSLDPNSHLSEGYMGEESPKSSDTQLFKGWTQSQISECLQS